MTSAASIPASPGHLAGLAAMKASGVQMIDVALPDLPFGVLMQSLYVESAAIFEELTLSGRDSQLIAPWADPWRRSASCRRSIIIRSNGSGAR